MSDKTTPTASATAQFLFQRALIRTPHAISPHRIHTDVRPAQLNLRVMALENATRNEIKNRHLTRVIDMECSFIVDDKYPTFGR